MRVRKVNALRPSREGLHALAHARPLDYASEARWRTRCPQRHSLRSIYIVAAKRTPFGTFGGKLKDRSRHRPRRARGEGRARRPATFPPTPSTTSCSATSRRPPPTRSTWRATSGSRPACRSRCPRSPSIACAARASRRSSAAPHEMLAGDAEIVLVGGTESMSQAPYAVRGHALGHALRQELRSSRTRCGRRCPTPTPAARWRMTAENLAEKYGITPRAVRRVRPAQPADLGRGAGGRAASPPRSRRSSSRAARAPRPFDTDEHPRPETTLEGLAKLPPVFKKDGVVTGRQRVGDLRRRRRAGARHRRGGQAARAHARWRAWCSGTSPASTRRSWASARCRRSAARSSARASAIGDDRSVRDQRGLRAAVPRLRKGARASPRDKTNVDGGAIALGHPLGGLGRAHHRPPRARAPAPQGPLRASARRASAAARASRSSSRSGLMGTGRTQRRPSRRASSTTGTRATGWARSARCTAAGSAFFDETLRDGIQSPSRARPGHRRQAGDPAAHRRASASTPSTSGCPAPGPRAVEDVTALVEFAEREKLGIEYACAARTHVARHRGDRRHRAEDRPVRSRSTRSSARARSACTPRTGRSSCCSSAPSWPPSCCREHGLPMAFVTEDTTRSPPPMLDRLFRAAVDHGVAAPVPVRHRRPRHARGRAAI